MKKLIALSLIAAAPATAHTGEAVHIHPHDGASWLALAGALALIALAGSLAASRLRGRS